MQVNSEDITVAWGQAPHPLDSQYGKWRMAVYQDVQESIDGTKLYFLYDPQADEQSGTSGTRKGYPGLIIFDLNFKCFAGEISLHSPGKMKFLFALKCPSPQGGSSFVLVTEEEIYGQVLLNIFRIDLARDGLSIANVRPLIPQALTIGGEYICSMRDDQPEIVVMSDPGLQIWQVDCSSPDEDRPVSYRTVSEYTLSKFNHAFARNGKLFFLSSLRDGQCNFQYFHLLHLDSSRPMMPTICLDDPAHGKPIPRNLCGLDTTKNAIVMAGGNVDRGVELVPMMDIWKFDTLEHKWIQMPVHLPFNIKETFVSCGTSGNLYIWGQSNDNQEGIRIFRVVEEKKGNKVMKEPKDEVVTDIVSISVTFGQARKQRTFECMEFTKQETFRDPISLTHWSISVGKIQLRRQNGAVIDFFAIKCEVIVNNGSYLQGHHMLELSMDSTCNSNKTSRQQLGVLDWDVETDHQFVVPLFLWDCYQHFLKDIDSVKISIKTTEKVNSSLILMDLDDLTSSLSIPSITQKAVSASTSHGYKMRARTRNAIVDTAEQFKQFGKPVGLANFEYDPDFELYPRR